MRLPVSRNSPAVRAALNALIEQRRDLSEAEAGACMEEIMTDGCSPAQFGAFVTALRLKGETVDELTGMMGVMRKHALHVDEHVKVAYLGG